ncbi:MAG: metal ABC transporter permease [Phycisphaerae bacterium]|nr:metal ABC transporter permease [Phycisphaerae bacterium]
MSGLLALSWQRMDTEIVVIAALGAVACALLGNFLVLRRMSLLGDAISHAVLPGLAAAFLLTGSRDSLPMLIGAAIVGVATAVLSEWIHRAGKVDPGAAMGIVFATLFALGLILIRRAADHVDIDPDCVLYGAIELAPLYREQVLGVELPRAAIVLGAVLLIDAAAVLLLYKELKISTFDPALATTQGIPAAAMHYLLTALVAITTVAAFESVGSILVIAMLIVPPAAAYLLTDRLGVMIVLSLVIAALSALGGHAGALVVPGWLGFAGVSTYSASMMAVCAGGLFALAALLGPRHGVLSKLAGRLALARGIAREDALLLLYRLEEAGAAPPASPAAMLRARHGIGPLAAHLALVQLRMRGLVRPGEGRLRLTPSGRTAAAELLRAHRLWETYLDQHLDVPRDHLHRPAERLEHVTDAGLRGRLAADLGHPAQDPQGKPIPVSGRPDAP